MRIKVTKHKKEEWNKALDEDGYLQLSDSLLYPQSDNGEWYLVYGGRV